MEYVFIISPLNLNVVSYIIGGVEGEMTQESRTPISKTKRKAQT